MELSLRLATNKTTAKTGSLNLKILLIMLMIKSHITVSFLVLIFLFFLPGSQINAQEKAERNYLYKKYRRKKETPDLFRVAAWRQAKKNP